MYRTCILGGLAAAGVLTFTSVHANDDAGIYVGASIGEATDKVDAFEDSGTSFKITGGYSFNRYFATELAYIDAGKLQDHLGGIDVTVESTGIVAAVLGRLPLGDHVAVFAKLGYAFYDEKVSFRLGDLRDSETHSDDDPLYGIGAEFHLGQRFKLRAEYEIVDIENADFDIVSVGTTFHF